ncbi:MAG: ATP-binding cassette domain-containing protein [Burkholderiales bacterium]|nr:ATP-binding cassette domain-containing protein [Burkholderiales bacterium]
MNVTSSQLLNVGALSVHAGAARLLHDISFDVAAGEVLALLGANGAGKSTLMMALAGEFASANQHITFDGHPLTAWSRHAIAQRRAVNASEPPVPFTMNAGDYVALGRPFVAPDDRAIAHALTECHAREWRTRDYATLSMGEQLRVQLARSLYQLGGDDPRERCLWLLDEPCAHLDMAQRHFVLTLIARIAKARRWAVVFSTHDPLEAQLIADRALLLRHGEALSIAPIDIALTEANLSACYGRPITRRAGFVSE